MPDGSEEGQGASTVDVKATSPTPKGHKSREMVKPAQLDVALLPGHDRSSPDYIGTVEDVERRAKEIVDKALAEETNPSMGKTEVVRGGALTRRSFLKKAAVAIAGGAVSLEAVRKRNSILSLLTVDGDKESSRQLVHEVEQARKIVNEHVVTNVDPVKYPIYEEVFLRLF